MVRLLSPDDACKGVDVPFGRGRRYDGTTIEVTDSSHVKALRQAGYTLADTAGAPVRRGGFECGSCGRKNYFRQCGKCGRHVESEE